MTLSTQPPARRLRWPGGGGPLLAALWASLTTSLPDHSSPTLATLDHSAPDGSGPGRPVPGGAGLVRPDWATAPEVAVAVLELAGLADADLRARPAPAAADPGWLDGIVPPDGFPIPVPPTVAGPGFGFGQGDPLDTAAPGPGLAALAEDTQGVLAGIDLDALTGVIRAWRRITSWAAGRELAAITELARRYPADGLPGSGREYVADELAAALTLTGRAAQAHRDLAWQLANILPGTLAALSSGLIDVAKARVIAAGTAELTAGHAAAVEAAVLPKAPGMTAGQLRAAVARAVLAADPEAARRQRAAAQQHAHVSCWTGQSGTAHLEGHDLPPAQTLAADTRLGQIAATWKAHGAQGGIDLLRAHAYLALLLGHDVTTAPASLLPPGHLPARPSSEDSAGPRPGRPAAPPAPTSTSDRQRGSSPGPHAGHNASPSSGPAGNCGGAPRPPAGRADAPSNGTASTRADGTPGPNRSPGPRLDPDAGQPGQPGGGPQVPPGLRPPAPEPGCPLPPVAALINLTIPLATLQQHADRPGEAAGYGPIAADTARLLAAAAAAHPATRWQLTVTSPDGRAVATGASPGRAGPDEGWTVTVTPITTGRCEHRRQEPGYRPSPALARLIRTRTTTCSFPGCRRPARRCDLDHTVPYKDGGRTCECDLAPLCRRHHRVKQAEGWTLTQPEPGVLVWLTPAGRRYTTLPSQHPT